MEEALLTVFHKKHGKVPQYFAGFFLNSFAISFSMLSFFSFSAL
jgi:hypothetical protein